MSSKPIIVTFKLFPGKDDDLIRFLKSVGSREKSAYIRLALRGQFISRESSQAGFLSLTPGTVLPEEKMSVVINSKPVAISDDDLEARLGRW